MARFNAKIERFGEMGDKTGWTYVVVPAAIAEKLKPGTRKAFRVRGKLDSFAIEKVSILPMGGGDYILPLNAKMRKGIAKNLGASITLNIEVDAAVIPLSQDLLESLEYAPAAKATFNNMTNSFRNYISKWIESAKTPHTKARRILLVVNSCERSTNYHEFIEVFRLLKKNVNDLPGNAP